MAKKKGRKKDKISQLEEVEEEREKAKTFWGRFEYYNAKLIPYALILLLIIIIAEILFNIENPVIELYLTIADYIVIIIFVIDLIFIAKRCDTTLYFFKNYWLDILAVFPFMIAFRLINTFAAFFIAIKEFQVGQSIVHETLEIRKGIAIASRTGKFTRLLRLGARIVRVITKSRFFRKIQ